MKTILLVDDSKVTRELIKVYLIARDVRLLDAPDGEAALALVRRERPDLVLCDLRMPRLDGPGLCLAMRADPALAAIPVIILTSNQDEDSHRRCREAGARDVLVKPIGPHALHDAVARTTGIAVGLPPKPAGAP